MNKLEIIKFVEGMRDRWDNASWQQTGNERDLLQAQAEAARIILDQICSAASAPDFAIGDKEVEA